jgi:L,D-transpeptidase YcbB
MRHLFVLLLFPLFFTSCDSAQAEEKKVDFLDDKQLSAKEKIKICLESENSHVLGLNDDQLKWVINRYESRGFKPIWHKELVLTEKGNEMQVALERSIWLGIPESRLKFKQKEEDNPIIEDILMTAKSALMFQDLRTGLFSDTITAYAEAKFIDPIVYDSLLKKPDSLSFLNFYREKSPTDTNYRFLADQLFTYCSSYPMDRTHFKIKPYKEDSTNTIIESKQALRLKGYLGRDEQDSLEFVQALKVFQVHNGLKPDGKVGKYTAEALNESTFEKVLRAALSLDKVRRKAAYPKKYIQVNLPEYTLRFFANDSLKSVHNIVIGTTDHQTPTLKSKVHTVVVYPYWNVPFSIASKEILPALKANKNYLTKHNYKIYRGETEVNPFFVNWNKIKKNSFPYRVVQDPGPKNSLGIIKFEFHNNYSVYIHDTPSKNYFRSDVRSFSHGCMRCENPVDLGRLLLNYDSLGRKANPLIGDSLDSLIGLAENFPVRLLKPVPVFVEYQTVVADREKIVFYLDIYKRDEEYLKIMRD